MKRVWIESPYAGDIDQNVEYARSVMRWALYKGCAPMCSHLIYTQPGILRDKIAKEREKGITAGLTWQLAADELWVATDLGISDGMKIGIDNWEIFNSEKPIIHVRMQGGSFSAFLRGRRSNG